MQEKELEIQRLTTEMKKIERNYAFELNNIKSQNDDEIKELRNLITVKDSKIEKIKAKMHNETILLSKKLKEEEETKNQIDMYRVAINRLNNDIQIKEEEIIKLKNSYKEIDKVKNELQIEIQLLLNKLNDEDEIKKQIEIYKVGNKGLKNDIKIKEDELNKLKEEYENFIQINEKQEKEINYYKIELEELKNLQIENNELMINYRGLKEEIDEKDQTITELKAKIRKFEHYLFMSEEAINNLKSLGLFNRLFNQIPEEIDELEMEIKNLDPSERFEIEPIRVRKQDSEVLGEEKHSK